MVVLNQKINTAQTTFGVRLKGFEYRGYSQKKDYNGVSPDSFVLAHLPQNPSFIFDFGAGQGRNSIPIAQLGNDVVCFEINKNGRNDIENKAKAKNIADKIHLVDLNLLDRFSSPVKADLIFMSHISQHFNILELRKVMNNAFNNLNTGGLFIFDALVRQKENYKNTISYQRNLPTMRV